MKTNSYPAWFYGPNGASQIFQSDDEVPAGWQDHPTKVETKEKAPAPVPTPAKTEPKPATAPEGAKPDDTGALDAGGWPWDEKLHAATHSKTKAGLWRMNVGVSRPAPKEGYPKPLLDL